MMKNVPLKNCLALRVFWDLPERLQSFPKNTNGCCDYEGCFCFTNIHV